MNSSNKTTHQQVGEHRSVDEATDATFHMTGVRELRI